VTVKDALDVEFTIVAVDRPSSRADQGHVGLGQGNSRQLTQTGDTNMTTHMKRFVVHAGAAALAVLSCIAWFPINGAAQAGNTKAFVAPVIFQAAGPNIASVQDHAEE
jgi:hypothetical protein